MAEIKSICFTGPRPRNLHGYNEYYRKNHYSDIVKTTADVICDFAGKGCGKFIAGGAQGFDQLAFWAVNRARKRYPSLDNIVYIPFEVQPSRWSEIGMFGQEEYRKMLEIATKTHICSPNPIPGDSRAAARALFKRNHDMVADSDLVIALLADRSLNYQTAAGGTAECVRYALSQGKPVFAIRYYQEHSPDTRFETGYLN